MSSEVTVFDPDSPIAVPDYLASSGVQSNIDAGVASVPSLSIRGKVFRIVKDGTETVMQRFDSQLKESVPLQMIHVVVLEQGPYGARVYYSGAYDPEAAAKPACFSLDGKRPDVAAVQPQAKTCAVCPHAVKGSKMSMSGMPTTACTLQRRLAVVPASAPEHAALLLRLPPTSSFDKMTKNSQSGWFAWRQYLDFLQSRGVTHTAQVVTAVRFDPVAETPKLLFRPERFLSQSEAAVVLPRIDSDEVKAMLFPSDEGRTDALPAPDVESEVEDRVSDAADEPLPTRKPLASKTAAPVENSAAIGTQLEELLTVWDD